MTCEFVEQDRHAVDTAAGLEMCLDFLGRSAIVDVADEDAARIDVLSVFANIMSALGVERLLHVAQLLRFFFHLLDTSLHGFDFFLYACLSAYFSYDVSGRTSNKCCQCVEILPVFPYLIVALVVVTISVIEPCIFVVLDDVFFGICHRCEKAVVNL